MERTTQSQPVSAVLTEIIDSAIRLFRSEVNYLKVEFQQNYRDILKQTVKLVIFGTFTLLGGIAFTAFLIILIGELIGGAYWLSSLIVAAALGIPGVLLSISALRKIGCDISLFRWRKNLKQDQKIFKEKAHDISEEITRLAA